MLFFKKVYKEDNNTNLTRTFSLQQAGLIQTKFIFIITALGIEPHKITAGMSKDKHDSQSKRVNINISDAPK